MILKKITYFTFFFSFPYISFSQNLYKIFLQVPNSFFNDKVSIEQREILIKKNHQKDIFGIYTWDEKNGFVEWSYPEGESITQMTIWNLGNNKKIVGIVKNSCGPACSTDIFKMYSWDNTKLKELSLSSLNILIYHSEVTDFLLKSTNSLIKKYKENGFDFLVELPQIGKDIVIKYQWEDYISMDEMRKELKGNKIKLIWKGNHFEKSEPYF